MDPTSAPGGFLGGYVLVGILLPIVSSFVLDGIVLYFRGRSPRVLLVASVLTLAILGLYSVAWQNGMSTIDDTGTALTDTMSGAVGLILWFSIPAAALGFGIRMLALGLNPSTRELDRQLVAARMARRAQRAREPVHFASHA